MATVVGVQEAGARMGWQECVWTGRLSTDDQCRHQPPQPVGCTGGERLLY